jgi:uncharacterized membrane protein
MITRSVVIRRPPDEVFAYLDDLEAHHEWQGQVVSAKVVTDGPTRVGTEVEETRSIGGREVRMRWRVSEHDPRARRSGFETIESSMVRPTGRIEVAPAGENSEVTFSIDPRPVGVGRLLAPILRRQVSQQVDRDLAALRQRLEPGP